MAEESKEVQTYNQLPSKINAKQFGIDIDEDDIPVPRLKLIQPTSKLDGAGKYAYSLNNKILDKVECVFLSNTRGRVMFDIDITKPPVCGSNDRVIPSPRFEKPMADRCINCRFNTDFYKEVARDASGTPILRSGKELYHQCDKNFVIKGIFIDTLMPFIFVVARTGLAPITSFLAAMQYECAKNQKPLCCFPLTLTSMVPSNATNKYYVPVVTPMGMIEKEEFITMMNKYSQYDVDKTFKAEEEAGESAEPSDGIPF